jgi:hypothetical protein
MVDDRRHLREPGSSQKPVARVVSGQSSGHELVKSRLIHQHAMLQSRQ